MQPPPPPQEVLPHSTPLFIGTLRLLPAGLALVAFSLSTGRQNPKSLEGWLWVAAFAVIDGTAFQVGSFA